MAEPPSQLGAPSDIRLAAPRLELAEALASLYEDRFGKRPQRVEVVFDGGDVLVVVLHGALTDEEHAYSTRSDHLQLRDARTFYQYAQPAHFCAPVERFAGRRVRAFMSGLDVREGVAAEVFVLEPPAGRRQGPEDRRAQPRPGARDRRSGRFDRRISSLEELVYSDDLTGLPNRRSIFQDLYEMLAVALPGERPLSALMLDIDCFKAVNDTHGHGVGDEVLRAVAQRLAGAVGAEDRVGRIGGDEFVVLTPGASPEKAEALAEAIVAGVHSLPVDSSAGSVEVTVSAGVATWEGETPSDLLKRADQALYAAKAAGRDTARRSPGLEPGP